MTPARESRTSSWHIHHLGLSYSVGVYGREPVLDALAALPREAWRRALDADGRPRDGAQVAELTRWLPGSSVGLAARVAYRPPRRPHPGAQLRITYQHGWRITLFATNTTGGRIASLKYATGCAPALRTASVLSKTPA